MSVYGQANVINDDKVAIFENRNKSLESCKNRKTYKS